MQALENTREICNWSSVRALLQNFPELFVAAQFHQRELLLTYAVASRCKSRGLFAVFSTSQQACI